jgi:S1-C subfamily serine protease
VNLSRSPSILAGSLLAAGLIVAAAPGRAAPPRAASPRSVTIRKVFPSAVRIQVAVKGEVVRSASGIAFARDEGKSYILTNAHVVEPSSEWKGSAEVRVLVGGRPTPLPARVLERGRVPDVDLALLEVADGSLSVTPLAPDSEVEVGEDLFVIGAPFGKGLSVAAGIISQVEYEPSDAAVSPRHPRMLKTDAAIGYGSSGGGVFDVPDGRLIGLVEGYRTARVAFGDSPETYAFDVPMPGETFVAPAAKIRRFLVERGLTRLAGGEGVPVAAEAFRAVPKGPSAGPGGANRAGAGSPVPQDGAARVP